MENSALAICRLDKVVPKVAQLELQEVQMAQNVEQVVEPMADENEEESDEWTEVGYEGSERVQMGWKFGNGPAVEQFWQLE